MAQDIQQIEQRLAKEIETLLSLKPGAVQADSLLKTLGLDSLRFVSLLIAIEKAFGVNLMKGGIKREALLSVRSLSAAVASMQKP